MTMSPELLIWPLPPREGMPGMPGMAQEERRASGRRRASLCMAGSFKWGQGSFRSPFEPDELAPDVEGDAEVFEEKAADAWHAGHDIELRFFEFMAEHAQSGHGDDADACFLWRGGAADADHDKGCIYGGAARGMAEPCGEFLINLDAKGRAGVHDGIPGDFAGGEACHGDALLELVGAFDMLGEAWAAEALAEAELDLATRIVEGDVGAVFLREMESEHGDVEVLAEVVDTAAAALEANDAGQILELPISDLEPLDDAAHAGFFADDALHLWLGTWDGGEIAAHGEIGTEHGDGGSGVKKEACGRAAIDAGIDVWQPGVIASHGDAQGGARWAAAGVKVVATEHAACFTDGDSLGLETPQRATGDRAMADAAGCEKEAGSGDDERGTEHAAAFRCAENAVNWHGGWHRDSARGRAGGVRCSGAWSRDR